MGKRIARKALRPLLAHDRVTVHHGDCLRVMAAMPADSVDTIVTDPPYGLEFMGKEWDKLGAYQGPRTGKEKAFPAANKNRVRFGKSAASMQSWHEAWARAALRVAKPGAILMAFGGTRTFHRLACAVEDAGWELRDTMMWCYGSGFPKSTNISKQLDKIAGAERKIIGRKKVTCGTGEQFGKAVGTKHKGTEIDITAPATDAAKLWDGWGTALKPAYEPILIAMKPLDGTFAGNAVEYGVAGLWIDGGRVGASTPNVRGRGWSGARGYGHKEDPELRGVDKPNQGRWPANLVLQHSPECVLVGTEPDPGYKINRFTDGAKPFGEGAGHEYETTDVPAGEREVYACVPGCPVRMLDGQAPGASRFFYTAKASTTERHLGCPPGYQNRHPTVKPLDLCRYLCRLTRTPTGGVVLDPFSGSGSIAVGALLEGRTAIAIELEEESAQATVTRVQAALKWDDKLQSLKKFKMKGRKKLSRKRR